MLKFQNQWRAWGITKVLTNSQDVEKQCRLAKSANIKQLLHSKPVRIGFQFIFPNVKYCLCILDLLLNLHYISLKQ